MTSPSENKKSVSLYNDASINIKTLLTLLAIAIIGVSIYLTQHYYSVRFPEGLSSGSFCNINSFFNCDSATLSQASSIFGVPISVLGMMIGVLLLAGYLFRSPKYEGTLHTILYVNAAGCIALFIYSVAALGSLCPFCSVYYALSLGVLALFWKKSSLKSPDIKVLAIVAVVFLIAGGISRTITLSKENNQAQLAVSLISQFDQYAKMSNPTVLSPHAIAKSTDQFDAAAIQLIIFSDFQCPACKALSEMMGPISRRYQGKINILYYFYPLDSSCNADMTMPLHPLACSLAYIAHCSGDKFAAVHDEIFEHQGTLSSEWVNNYAKKLGVETCMNETGTKEKVVELLQQSKQFNVRSTPTLVLNGVKIEGALPLNQFYILMDELVKRHESK